MTAALIVCDAVPQPFVKWVGGKRKLVPELRARIPPPVLSALATGAATYHEPFLGGGALFFSLLPQRAVLSDMNSDLVRAYVAVRDCPDAVIEILSGWPRSKEKYLTLRAHDPELLTDEGAAARFIYLLKCGFNGLWRTNKVGKFNVPFGDNTGLVCDAPVILAASRALQGVKIHHGDFASMVPLPRAGDLVYFDPPYVPLSATSNFTGYAADGFGDQDQIRLRNHAAYLKAKGVNVLLSNSNAPRVRELYGATGFHGTAKLTGDFEIGEVQAARSVNSKATGRGKITELVIT